MAAQSTAVADNGGSRKKSGASLLTRVRDYFDDLKTEMRHVTWPSTVQVRATTVVVIVSVFLFAAYFAVVDLVLGRAITQIFDALVKR